MKAAFALLFAAASLAPAPSLASDHPQARPLGRLFHSPEARAELENRKASPPSASSQPTEPVFQGQVIRSSGHRTIWRDGEPIHDPGPAVEARHRPAAPDRPSK